MINFQGFISSLFASTLRMVHVNIERRELENIIIIIIIMEMKNVSKKLPVNPSGHLHL